MERIRVPATLTVLFGWALLTANVHAQEAGKTFVYTNNNPLSAPNSVSAFSVGPGGILVMVPGSPFPTLGTGSGNGNFGSHHITATVTRNFLYVANDGSNNISVFKINTDTGGLTLVSGSPFATGGSATIAGMSLAATPNGRFLYAGNADSGNISAFRIASNGALTPIGPLIPAGGTPDGIKVSPNGQFLGVARHLIVEKALGLAARIAAAHQHARDGEQQGAPHRLFPASSCDCALRSAATASSVRKAKA